MQLVGLKAVYAGDPLPKGVKDEGAAELMKAYKKIAQPYKGGVNINFSNPSSTKFYREGERNPFAVIFDPTTGEQKVSWAVADFDDDTLEFYFGTTEPQEGELYEGEKGFVFVTEGNEGKVSLAVANLKYAAIITGGLNTSDPLQISVEGDVQAPKEGGYAWWRITTPEFTEGATTTTSEG